MAGRKENDLEWLMRNDEVVQDTPSLEDLIKNDEIVGNVGDEGEGDGLLLNATAGLNQAIYNTAGAPVDLSRWLINKGIDGVNAVAGTEIGNIPTDSFGGSESIASMFNAVGVPMPEDIKATTTAERLARGFGEGAGYTVAPAGAVGLAGRSGLLGGRALDAGRAMFGAPASGGAAASNAFVGGTSGLGATAGMEMAPDEHALLAGLGGGLAGGGLGALALHAPAALRSIGNPLRGRIVDAADDAVLARTRADDFTAIGVEPTAGMVSNSGRNATRERALAATKSGGEIQRRIDSAFGSMDDEFTRVVDGIATRNNPAAKTNTRQELGSMLRDQVQQTKDAALNRSVQLYDDVAARTATTPVSGTNTTKFLEDLTRTRAELGKSDAINIGPQIDDVIRRAGAIVEDVASGRVGFNTLREERTRIGRLMSDEALDPASKKHLEGLYGSLTRDMERTAAAAGPDALQAYRKANNHYRRYMDPEKGFGRGGEANHILAGKSPEDIFRHAMAKGKEGGTRLSAIRRQVDREDGRLFGTT